MGGLVERRVLQIRQGQSILEGDIHVVSDWAVKVKLRFRLVPERKPLRLERIDIPRHFYCIARLNLPVIPFLSEQSS